MTLYYNSQDAYSGPLGKGWITTIDLSVREGADGYVVLREGNGFMQRAETSIYHNEEIIIVLPGKQTAPSR